MLSGRGWVPTKAPSGCRRPGCPGLVRDGVCSVCGPKRRSADAQRDAERGNSAQRGYGSTWRKLRAMVLADQPLCVICLAAGHVVSATDVDHIVPKRAGGRDEIDNLQALCHECHSRKTLAGS